MGNLRIPEWILKKIQEAMWATVNEVGGTGYAARLDTVEVCGKTGTVEVKKGDQIVKQGWFVAYAPSRDPQIVLVLLVEGVYSGGRDVAPLAKKVLQRYFGIPSGSPELISIKIPGVLSRWPVYLPKKD